VARPGSARQGQGKVFFKAGRRRTERDPPSQDPAGPVQARRGKVFRARQGLIGCGMSLHVVTGLGTARQGIARQGFCTVRRGSVEHCIAGLGTGDASQVPAGRSTAALGMGKARHGPAMLSGATRREIRQGSAVLGAVRPGAAGHDLTGHVRARPRKVRLGKETV